VYRFLRTPRWLGLAVLTVFAAAAMVRLGFWQLDRYHERAASNDRITAAAAAQPRPLAEVVGAPATGSSRGTGPVPAELVTWTRVTVTGEYDGAHEILIRDRSLAGRVGFQVVTPLRLADGTAVLIDRGWIPPAPGGAIATPPVPPPPTGQVSLIGTVRLPESSSDPVNRRPGYLAARRISPARAAAVVPYPLYGVYLSAQSQQPPADPRLQPVPARTEWALQNAGYAVQWWLFAIMVLVGYGHLARREAHEAGSTSGRGMDGADGVEGVGHPGGLVRPVPEHPGEA